MSSKTKIVIACAVVAVAIAVRLIVALATPALPALTYTQFLGQVRAGTVASAILMSGNSAVTPATLRLKDGKTVHTTLPSDYRDALAVMQEEAVNVEIRDSSSGAFRPLANVIPFLLLLALWLFLINRKFRNGPTLRALLR